MSHTQLALWLTFAILLVFVVKANSANFGMRRRRITHDSGHTGDAGSSGGWFASSGDSCDSGSAGDGGGSCSDGGGDGGD